MKAGQDADLLPHGRWEFSAEGIYSVGQDAKGRAAGGFHPWRQGRGLPLFQRLSRYRSFSYGRGLEATSAAFLKEDDARLAVLVSSIEESGEGESEKTYTRAERVMLYDSRLNVAGEIPLEGELCTALGAENGRLYLFIDKNMEIYEEKDGSWQNTGTRKLRHQVTQCHITGFGWGRCKGIYSDGWDGFVLFIMR